VVLLATDINAFHIVGAALALWAVALAAIGVLRPDFPPKGLEKVIIGISALLVVGAITSAIAVSGGEEPKGSEQAGVKNRTGKEGSPPPAAGTGTPAPGTGANSGQSTPGKKNAKKPPAQATAQTLALSADPSGALKFNKATLAAKAGNVRIVLTNPAPVPHNVSLEGRGLNKEGPTVPKGGNSQVQATLKAGTYTFFCSVPGHRQAGMEGTLTVK